MKFLHLGACTLACFALVAACGDDKNDSDLDAGGAGGESLGGSGGSSSASGGMTGSGGATQSLTDCVSLCAATVRTCAGTTQQLCEFSCSGLRLVCPAESDEYFSCAASTQNVVCPPLAVIGVASGCETEAVAVDECAQNFGGAGGQGGANTD